MFFNVIGKLHAEWLYSSYDWSGWTLVALVSIVCRKMESAAIPFAVNVDSGLRHDVWRGISRFLGPKPERDFSLLLGNGRAEEPLSANCESGLYEERLESASPHRLFQNRELRYFLGCFPAVVTAALARENLAAGQRGHLEYRLEPEGRSLAYCFFFIVEAAASRTLSVDELSMFKSRALPCFH